MQRMYFNRKHAANAKAVRDIRSKRIAVMLNSKELEQVDQIRKKGFYPVPKISKEK